MEGSIVCGGGVDKLPHIGPGADGGVLNDGDPVVVDELVLEAVGKDTKCHGGHEQ